MPDDPNVFHELHERVERRLFSDRDGWERARLAAQRPWNNRGRRSIPIRIDDDDIVVSAALARGQRLEAAIRDALKHLAMASPDLDTIRRDLNGALRDAAQHSTRL